jgi:hypothetical protein
MSQPEPTENAAEQDSALDAEGTATEPADRISLSGRNRVYARIRVLAGLTLGSGVVASIGGGIDTTVSIV